MCRWTHILKSLLLAHCRSIFSFSLILVVCSYVQCFFWECYAIDRFLRDQMGLGCVWSSDPKIGYAEHLLEWYFKSQGSSFWEVAIAGGGACVGRQVGFTPRERHREKDIAGWGSAWAKHTGEQVWDTVKTAGGSVGLVRTGWGRGEWNIRLKAYVRI